MKFTNTITIDRPPHEVFSFLAELENVPQWNYAISETRKITPGPVGVGSKFIQVRTLPERSEEPLEVVEYQPDRTLSFRGKFGPFVGRTTYSLNSMGNTTRLINEIDLTLLGLLSVLAPLATAQVKSAVAENLDTLRQILNGR